VTATELDRIKSAPAVAGPNFVGQATAVEQSRAVAEVQAAIVVAQNCPRNIPGAIEDMRQSCKQTGLAERAFFRFSRGGSTVSGASVHLARELARCWGNVQYGIAELRRDDNDGYSEMQAWAWDVQTNTRSSQTFVVPHKRDKRGGPERLTDMRDIYENNANNGARRLREAIFSILPPWFTEEAKEICSGTLKDGGGKPLGTRIADAITAFQGIGVPVERIEARLDRKSAQWTEHDVAQLVVIFKSIQRGEVNVEDEFPRDPNAGAVSADELGVKSARKTRGEKAPVDLGGAPEAEGPPADPWGGHNEAPS
jgi:hypothetical protein